MGLFSLISLLFYAIFLGTSMKIADLLDEHGMRWFPGDRIVFGFLWGLFGIFLVLSRNDIANILLARIIAYIPRKSLDYFNHALAATMIIIAFIWKATIHPFLFFIFLLIFLVFGFLKDYYGNGYQKRDILFHINEQGLYYIIATVVYGFIVNDFTAFLVFTFLQISYNAVKYGFYFMGWSKEI